MAVEIGSMTELNDLIGKGGKHTVCVIGFYNSRHKDVAPTTDKLSKQPWFVDEDATIYGPAYFGKVDLDKLQDAQDVTAKMKLWAVPTTIIFKGGEIVDYVEFVEGNLLWGALERKVNQVLYAPT